MSLAKLVVHLQANYSGLTSGLAVARNQTVVAAQQIAGSVSGIAASAAGLETVQTRAEQVSIALGSVGVAADAAVVSASAAAIAAETTASGLRFAAQSCSLLSSGLTVLDKGTLLTVRSLNWLARVLDWLAWPLWFFAGLVSRVATTLHGIVAAVLRVSTVFRAVSQRIRTVTETVLHLLHVIHAAKLVLSLLNTALSVLLQLMRGLAAAMKIFRPIISLALAVFKVWFWFKGWIAVIKIIRQWLDLLPPKVRLLVVSLLALGVAARAGALAVRALAFAFRVLGTVARGAMTAIATAAHVATLGISGAISSLTSLGSTMVKIGTQTAVYGAIAASVWGVKLAAAAETSRVVFGSMIHDMEQGKALLEQMQGSTVAPFFDTKQIQDAGRDLIKAKVPIDQITSRMEQLGAIALATKTPIEELSAVYRSGAGKTVFQLEEINNLSRKGVDIMAALTAVTGKSGLALRDMISNGKIGIPEMNAALDHMTKGHGIYSDVVSQVSQTASGLWSKSLSNISLAIQTMFGTAVDGNKGLLASWVELTEQIKQRAATIGPVIMQLTSVVTGLFRGLYDVASTVWTSIFGVTQTTFSGMLSTTMEWITKFRWFFENLVPIVQFVGLQLVLWMVTAFNDISMHLTNFAQATMAVFSNLAGNIKNAMGEIWKFIKSGGSQGLEFTWTPLLDGFKATVERMPTALEDGLQSEIDRIGTNLADSFDDLQSQANASMAAAASTSPPVPLQSTPAGGGGEENESFGESKNKSDNSPLLKGSREAQAAIYAAIAQGQSQKDKAAQKAAEIAKKQLEEAQKLNLRLAMAGNIAVIESLEG